MAEPLAFDAPLTLPAQIEARAQHPVTADRVVLMHDERQWTYGQFRDESVRMALSSKLDPEESRKKAENGEPAIIRLRIPNDKEVRWNDLVRGETIIHSKELDDFVIARSIDDPLYHLTVVTDDHDMEITHVIRGEDHISNTPKQILLFHALGWKEPEYAHLPLILNEDRSKLSKRKNKV